MAKKKSARKPTGKTADAEPAPEPFTLNDLKDFLSLDGPRGTYLPAGFLELHYGNIGDDPSTQAIRRWCRRNRCDLLALADFLIDERGIDQSAVWTLPLDRVPELLKAAPPAPSTPPAEPPPLYLEIVPGGIKYGTATVDLSGKPLACIEALVDAHNHRLAYQRLRDRVWGNDAYTSEATIKNTISDARAALRKLLRQAGRHVSKGFDPLPCVDSGKNLAWKLNLS